MENKLQCFLSLNGEISEINSDNFIYTLDVTDKDIPILKEFYDFDYIEQIKNKESKIVIIDKLSNFLNKTISIEFVTSELKKIGFYLTINDFINNNRFEIPTDFYIVELSYSNSSQINNEKIEKYKVVTTLINRLTAKSKFISEEHNKTLCLVQDNSFIEIPIETIAYEDYIEYENINLIKQYLEDIDSYKEKRTIFLMELINFLSNKTKNERLNELILYFEEFYEKCNTSFEYYLSNFSFNKIKFELDNSVLEYSKNIRSIINESQSKLIAIPAAFILGISQTDYNNPFALRNILIVFSSFLFSYMISVFIKNQKNAIEIISDNLNNYKANYKRSKETQFEEEKELTNLSELINRSYKKTEKELTEQEKRLKVLQRCNWGISIALFLSIIIVASSQNLTNILELWQQLIE